MTLIAGAFSIAAGVVLPPPLKAALRQHLRRAPDERGSLSSHDSQALFLVKWDSGSFKEPAWREGADGSLATLVGDPLLADGGARLSRAEQLAHLTGPDAGLNDGELARTRGAFSIAAFSATTHTLTLATDMIGLRPLYYTVQDGVLLFASALRILESMPGLVRKPSTTGVVESCVFGFPLAERTPYANIAVLRECQKLSVSQGGAIALTNYHDWTSAGPVPDSAQTAARELFAEFQAGIRLRLATDQRVYAFLSGGMDSRAIVSALASMGRDIEALNFSPDASQDQVYARQFAETLGARCRLSFLPRDDDPNFSMLAFNAKTRLEQTITVGVDRPAFLWSGDGGSVGLGHVYMDQAMLALAERGDYPAALDHFLSFNGLSLPVKVLSGASRAALQQMIAANAVSEINRYPRADAGRRLYLFLLFNDQRRHLFKHFESIDQHGLEFLLPFYDVRFLQRVADTPAAWGVLHKLYALWFEQLDPSARATPWQTYPGHQPCPVKGDDSLSYQWAGRNGEAALSLSERLGGGRYLAKQALGATLPVIFSRPRLLLAAVLHASGLRNCGHILTMLVNYRQLGVHAN